MGSWEVWQRKEVVDGCKFNSYVLYILHKEKGGYSKSFYRFERGCISFWQFNTNHSINCSRNDGLKAYSLKSFIASA